MGNKKFTKTDLFILVLFPIIFIAGVIIYNTNHENYYKKSVKIRHNDSLNIIVNIFRLNRGVLHFNNSYFVENYNSPSDKNNVLWEMDLETPFVIKKDNDTITLHEKIKVYYIILDSKKGATKQIGDMSILEFLKKYFKKNN